MCNYAVAERQTQGLTHPCSTGFPANISFLAMWRKQANTLIISEIAAALMTQRCFVLQSLWVSSSKLLVKDVKLTNEKRVRAAQY
jgi:hypothetical protein